MGRLVRPPSSAVPLVRVAELLVRTSCVGESLTVAVLRASRERARPSAVAEVIARIARDEAEHAELGWTFLDWADERLTEADRAHLGRVATAAVSSFAPLFTRTCAENGALGVMSCDAFDAAFADALARRVDEPLGARGITLGARTSAI